MSIFIQQSSITSSLHDKIHIRRHYTAHFLCDSLSPFMRLQRAGIFTISLPREDFDAQLRAIYQYDCRRQLIYEVDYRLAAFLGARARHFHY